MQVIERGRWTVQQLIDSLEKNYPTAIERRSLVVMSQDEEGNGFAQLAGFGLGRIKAPERGYGWTDELYEISERAPGSEVCLVLWPKA